MARLPAKPVFANIVHSLDLRLKPPVWGTDVYDLAIEKIENNDVEKEFYEQLLQNEEIPILSLTTQNGALEYCIHALKEPTEEIMLNSNEAGLSNIIKSCVLIERIAIYSNPRIMFYVDSQQLTTDDSHTDLIFYKCNILGKDFDAESFTHAVINYYRKYVA